MAQPFIGQITIVGFDFAPKGWAFCNGQTLPIAQNQALFAILGTTYGGNGVNTFALPNLQGSVPIHRNGQFPQGAKGGEANHTLIMNEMPNHTHPAMGATNATNVGTPGGNYWATDAGNPYSNAAPNQLMNPTSSGMVGGNQPHNNMQPYLVVNYIIALQGLFPSRN